MSNLPETFSPRPEYISQVLRDVRDPSLSLQYVADRLGTSVDALCVWLTRPEIADLLDRYECACSRRAALIIADQLPKLVEMVRTMLTNVHEEEKRLASEPPSPGRLAARRSARSLALNGIRLLTGLARPARMRQPAAVPRPPGNPKVSA